MGRGPELWHLTRGRLVLLAREPEILFWVFAFPLLLAGVLGFAFRRSEPAPSRALVLPGDGAAALASRLAAGERLEAEVAEDPDEALLALRNGAVDAVLTAGDPPRVRLDPERPEAELARLRVARALAEPSPPEDGDGAPFELEPVTAVGSRYVDFLFPGLIGLNLMGTGMWSIGFGVADLRKRKVLKRLLVTPMRRSSLLLSFLLARLVFLAAELAVLLAFGALVLDVPIRGGLVQLGLLALVGAATFAGLGLLVTSRVRTVEGASGMLNLVMVPMWLGSGVFFSYERFPDAVQPVLRALPLTALNDALRGLMLDGRGLAAVGLELAVLVGWGVGSFLVALRIFRWS